MTLIRSLVVSEGGTSDRGRFSRKLVARFLYIEEWIKGHI
jgi:hypothetical protein